MLLAMLAANTVAQPVAWEIRGSGGGGALYAPSFSPHRRGELYLQCDMSEVFHSTNFGKRWSTVDFRQLGSVLFSPVAYTSDKNVLYALHNGVNGRRRPARSTDGGSHWTVLPSDPTGGVSYALLADPHAVQRVLLAGTSTVYLSNDGGTSFTAAVSAGSHPSGCRMAGAFFSGDSCFLATSIGLFLCTDLTVPTPVFAPVAATGIPATERIWAFAASREGSTLRFCCLTFDSASVKPGVLPQRTHTNFRNVYTLDGGQGQWTNRTASIPAGSLPAFVDMCENDVDDVWLCGEGADAFGRRVFSAWKSSDGGLSFGSALTTANNGNILTAWGGQNGDNGWGWWGCPNGFDLDPKDPDVAAFCDMGWIHVTTDGGASWAQAYSDSTVYHASGSDTPKYLSYASAGLEPTCSYWMTWIDSLTMLASFADIVAQRSTDGGRTWSFHYTGLLVKTNNDAGVILKHPSTNMLYAATGEIVGANGIHTDARAASIGRVCLSADNGITWQVMHDFGHTVQSIAFDPAHPSRMYACVLDVPGGAGGIYACNDISRGAASQWIRLAAPPRTEGRAKELQVLRDGTLVAVYGARDKGGWQFTPSSGVFLSSDGGASWIDRSAVGMRDRVNSLLVDPADTTDNTWYAFVGLAGATGQPGVHRSNDRGASWTRIVAQGAWSGTFNPRRPDDMVLCTDGAGLMYLRNARGATPVAVSDSAFPFRNPMRAFFNPYDDRQLWVMTFGNGMYVGMYDSLPLLAVSGTPEAAPMELHVSPNPARGHAFVTMRMRRSGRARLVLHDVLGARISVLADDFFTAGTHRFPLDLSPLAAGVYFLRVSGDDASSVSRFIFAP
ncbi:MAG: T9SS type A sorting domain-containing protein [Ignavibacteria bacterium]|nr:T9SS type A sorting domain-containing protein [Ignavibacteria bacterium]